MPPLLTAFTVNIACFSVLGLFHWHPKFYCAKNNFCLIVLLSVVALDKMMPALLFTNFVLSSCI